jgi:hypothetical protein
MAKWDEKIMLADLSNMDDTNAHGSRRSESRSANGDA